MLSPDCVLNELLQPFPGTLLVITFPIPISTTFPTWIQAISVMKSFLPQFMPPSGFLALSLPALINTPIVILQSFPCPSKFFPFPHIQI